MSNIGLIIIGYPCIGKSSIAGCANGIIDLESSYFSKDDPMWYNDYCALAEDLASQGFTVCVSSHSSVVSCLKQRPSNPDVTVVVVHPDLSLKDDWIRRAELRMNDTSLDKDKRAYMRIASKYEEDINTLSECGFPTYEITELPYDLMDIVNYIYTLMRKDKL